jgi:hypothetical protein
MPGATPELARSVESFPILRLERSARAEYEIASRLTEGQHAIHDEIENRLAKIAQAH